MQPPNWHCKNMYETTKFDDIHSAIQRCNKHSRCKGVKDTYDVCDGIGNQSIILCTEFIHNTNAKGCGYGKSKISHE